MVITLKKGATPEELKQVESKIKWGKPSKKIFDAKKFNGFIKFKEDGLAIQKKIRNEWERNIG